MIQRSKEDRRAHNKGRKSIGRRKDEIYSVLAYRAMMLSLSLVLILMLTFIMFYK